MEGRLERKRRAFFKLACKGLALPLRFVSSCSNNNVLMVLHFNNIYLLIFPLFFFLQSNDFSFFLLFCVSFCKV